MTEPFFSICVPQYNRTSFLLEACRNWSRQTFRNFELCISDDCSTDGRADELTRFLENSGMRFVYRRQETNQRYDGNLRAALALASGKYCLLMGNDDSPASERTLERLHEVLKDREAVGVVITNYQNCADGRIFRRARASGIFGQGPDTAANRFRDFSFVSGVILRRDRAHAHATTKWDGSEMYQMYVGCRILAEGFALLDLDEVMIDQGIQIAGETVDSYARRPRLQPCPIQERPLPLGQMGRLVCDAIAPYAGRRAAVLYVKVFAQILGFTYPFWIFEYRRVQSWRYAVGICLGMRPRRILAGVALDWRARTLLRSLYAAVTGTGLLAPVWLFSSLQPALYRLAKSLRRSGSAS